jgi:phosphoglycolate phosphatase-like HAD superfamily hydrolase
MSTVPFDATGAALPGVVSSRSTGVARLPAQARLALPKVLLCDLDGTLIDSILARELYLATCGLPFEKQLEEIFPEDPRNADASAEFEGRKPARCNAIRMSPETRRALQAMRDLGVRIAVSSNNGIENVNAFARNAGFKFDLVLGYGNGLAKGRTHLDATSREFGTSRQEMLFVGDSLHDGEIAEREGIPFVGIATTFSPDRFALRFPSVPVVRRFSALPALFT